MKTISFLSLAAFSLSAFGAAKPLIVCGKDDKTSVYFELRESDTEYELEFRETLNIKKSQNSVVYGLLYGRALDGHRYQTILKSPKIRVFGDTKSPTCKIEEEVFYCTYTGSGSAEVNDLNEGKKESVFYSRYEISSSLAIEEWVSGWQEIKSRERLFVRSLIQGTLREYELECKAVK